MTKNNPFDRRAVSSTAAMRTAIAALTAALSLLVLAGGAAAHGPPAQRDQDVRLLADHSDDCGSDDAGALTECGNTHDLVGLDLREAHDATLGDMVYFRFILNGGSGTLKDVLTMKVGGASKTFELRTSDNQAFQGTGFETFAKAPALNADGSQDGSRFVVEAGVKLSALGGAGAVLDDYVLQAYRGTTRGDVMPGCYYNALGSKVAECSPGDDQPQFERTNGYVLRGPTYYTTVTVPAIDVPAGGSVDVDVKLANPLRATAQTVTLLIGAPDGAGVTATWKDSQTATTTVDLGKAGSGTAKLHVQADAAASAGKLTLTVTTNLGGRSIHEVPFGVGAAATSHPTTRDAAQDSPAPVAALTALGLLACAAARRRR